MVLEADGPWEQLARFRATQAWTAPASTTRRNIFAHVAGRAGIAISSSSVLPPSTAWTTETPAFSIAPGESAAATLRRLLAPTADVLRVYSLDGSFELCGLDFDDAAPSAESAFGFTQPDTDNPNPLLAFDATFEREPNWARAAGPDRYADKFLHDLGITAAPPPFPTEPLFELVRDPYATDDTKTTNAANAALERAVHLVPQGELLAPLASQFELYDVISVELPGAHGFVNSDYRIIERGADYRIGPKGQPAYNSVFGLARR